MAPTTYDNMASQSGTRKNVNELGSWQIFKSAFAKASHRFRVCACAPLLTRDVIATRRTTRCMSTTGAGVVRRCSHGVALLSHSADRSTLFLARSGHSGSHWRHRLLHMAC